MIVARSKRRCMQFCFQLTAETDNDNVTTIEQTADHAVNAPEKRCDVCCRDGRHLSPPRVYTLPPPET